jgi:hypothetical protein
MVMVFAFFIGCTVSSRSASYRPANSTAAAYQIMGHWDKANGTVTITFDGKEVVSTLLGMFSSSKALTLEATYDGHKVTAVFTKTPFLLRDKNMICTVMVNGEVAAKFEWGLGGLGGIGITY